MGLAWACDLTSLKGGGGKLHYGGFLWEAGSSGPVLFLGHELGSRGLSQVLDPQKRLRIPGSGDAL